MNQNRSTLVLMEQVVMILVFAIAAALCVQAFALSNQKSRESAALDRAVLQAQSAAELMKRAGEDPAHAMEAAREAMGGQISQGMWYVLYDYDWNAVSEGASYRLEAFPEALGGLSPQEGLAQVVVRVSYEDGGEIFSLPIAWQEVSSRG